jgi:formylglycine-generating enzyme required for sulfatase activity
MRSFLTLPLCGALLLSACVESAEAPKLIPQAEISYGAKLFLADETREVALSPARCTRFGTARIETSSTSTTVVVTATDGKTDAIDPLVPFNCYVPVAPKTLKVDVVETPNALFQFCLDTGICKTPNPADASKDQLCSSEELFDDCPVVEVPQQQASNYCAFIGRRLPTVFEQLAMRQGNVTDPATLKIYPTGATTPETCADAVLKTAGCNTAKPTPLSLGDNPAGAAARDTITGTDGKKIYDLMGNVAEWSQDLFPIQRGNAASYPWFCIAALPDLNNDGVPDPTCPTGAKCVYGEYQPVGHPFGVHPVCVTTSGSFSGGIGSLAGGSYKDAPDRSNAGIFGRRTEADPQGLPDTARAREFGIRCVDDRDSKSGMTAVRAFDPLEILQGP